MIKKRIILCLVRAGLLLSLAFPAAASGHAIGLILGEPTGFRFQLDLKPRRQLNLGLGWGFYRHYYYHASYYRDFRLTLAGDYTFLFPDPLKINQPYELYAGVGAFLRTNWESFLGVRVPLGLQAHLGNSPVDLFIELGPGMTFFTDTSPFMTGGLGIMLHLDKLKK